MIDTICCPICNSKIKREHWSGPMGLEEEYIDCDTCGYHYKSYYGYYNEIAGNKCFYYTYLTPLSQMICIRKRINKALYKAKRNWRKHKKKCKVCKCFYY